MLELLQKEKDSIQKYWMEFFSFMKRYKGGAWYLVGLELIRSLSQVTLVYAGSKLVQHAMMSARFDLVTNELRLAIIFFFLAVVMQLFLQGKEVRAELRGVSEAVLILGFSIVSFANTGLILLLLGSGLFARQKGRMRYIGLGLSLFFSVLQVLRAIGQVTNMASSVAELLLVIGIIIISIRLTAIRK